MNKRILLYDDDESVRRMLARVLELAGFTTLPGDPAWPAAPLNGEEQPPDAVLLDFSTRDSAGWGILEWIKRIFPTTPVIAFTLWPSQQDEVLRRGASACIQKPLDPTELLGILCQLLGSSKLVENSPCARSDVVCLPAD